MSGAERVLVADIGGTHARLATAVFAAPGQVVLERIEIRRSTDYPTLDAVIEDYGGSACRLPAGASLAVAGPIRGGTAHVTNVGWDVDAAALARGLGFARVVLMNDFAALAYAVPSLGRDELISVKPGARKMTEPISVMGAGTGFGVAMLVPCGMDYGLVATEGGHASFAPVDEDEVLVWRHLRAKNPHVSIENILSGTGLANLHEALHALRGVSRRGRPEEISRRALAEPNSTSARALELFCNIFGSVAGNIALTQGATGGVFLGGGVLIKNLPSLRKSRFVERFSAKGVMTPLLAGIPVDAVSYEYTALRGAALWYARSEK